MAFSFLFFYPSVKPGDEKIPDTHMEIAYTGNSLISNVKATNKNYYGLYLYNSSNITVSNSGMNGNFNGIYIQKSRNTKIINNNVSLNSGTGIHLDHSSHNEIYLNDFITVTPQVNP